ncbi:MAG: 2,3-bisphosphoglycerate-independent phosphoglycerate mutase [Erysipelotrichaceae bacterium]
MNKRPVVLVVMDGVGVNPNKFGNAVENAYTPTLDNLLANHANTILKAHGSAVGMPTDDDMGNSEVGHNAIGCGQIYSQGAKLVNESIASGDIYLSPTWKELVSNAQNHTMHFIGLLSDGNIHSNINHLLSMLKQCKEEGLKRVRVHALLDGRDVPATSALEYIDILENLMSELNDDNFDSKIASGGGRMKLTMDRYDADWSMVEAGWKHHVLAEGREFSSATEAIETYRKENDVIDQDLPGFVVSDDNGPVGKIVDGDSVILFNFRGDRAIELSKTFEMDDFDKFDRGNKPNVMYAGMLQYDGDLQLPKKFLVEPPKIKNTLTEYLVSHNINQYALSETQKFGHVTYFWNGNRSEKFSEELETWQEVKSDLVPFEQRPWMKSAEITDAIVTAIESKKYDFLRVNYPNGDMVGHTGHLEATIVGVESVDLALGRIIKAVDKVNGILVITADHGNADQMYEKQKNPEDKPKAKTSHTLFPVPFIIYGKQVEIKEGNYGLANIAQTVVKLLELPNNDNWLESIIK